MRRTKRSRCILDLFIQAYFLLTLLLGLLYKLFYFIWQYYVYIDCSIYLCCRFCVSGETCLLISSCFPGCTSADPTGRIFVKFYTGDFSQKSVGKSHSWLIWNKNIGLGAVFLLATARNVSWLNDGANGRNPFFLLLCKSHGFVLLNSACKITTLQMERIVTFPLQQWLCEGATILLYTSLVFFMVYVITLSVVRIEL